jgi:hypothetical protein
MDAPRFVEFAERVAERLFADAEIFPEYVRG